MWFRIELNKDRSVRSCVEVSGSISEGRSIHYIEADSKASAISILARAFERRKQLEREGKKKLVARYALEGRCRNCPRPSEAGRAYCSDCTDRRRTRDRERAAGRPSLVPRLLTEQQKAKSTLSRREKRQQRYRANPTANAQLPIKKRYQETLEAFETMTPSRFRGWLVAKIAECQDKIDGKKSIAEHFPQAAE